MGTDEDRDSPLLRPSGSLVRERREGVSCMGGEDGAEVEPGYAGKDCCRGLRAIGLLACRVDDVDQG
jgi:hypothetical protein